MVEKIGTIKNPLTIIAIFAAVAEISGTVVLPFIASENQSTYLWFLIVFPIVLIVFFFLTLNFNHRVLYAPSDYQNEDNFLKSLQHATFAEKALKIEAELAAIENITPEVVQTSGVKTQNAKEDFQSRYKTLVRSSPQTRYIFAEELIFQKLSKEFSSKIQREVGERCQALTFDLKNRI